MQTRSLLRSPLVAIIPLCAVVVLSSCHSATTAPSAAMPAADAGVDAAVPPPPRVCKTPSGTPAQPWFGDATADVGLAKTATLEPLASSMIAADLDGDGWADVVATAGGASRGNPTADQFKGKRTRFVFMNQADPADATHRIFVDTTMASGVLATRDGMGDRGFNMANAGDVDNDGDVDLILCSADEISATYTPQDPCDAFLNDGKGHFTLGPTSALDAKPLWFPGGALLDYDRDGVLDFWPATIAHWPYDPSGPNKQPPTLYRGGGDGSFADVSAMVGLPTKDGTLPAGTQWRSVFGNTACDIDGDGDDDMIFADYGREEAQVWRNDNGHFVNVAHGLGIDYDDRMDYSDDESYRCFCAEDVGACPATVPAAIPSFCTAFMGQDGRGWAPGISDKPYSLGGNYFSFACGDVDDDGDMDLMSATITHGDTGSASDPSELILNPGNGGKFTRPGNETNGILRPETGIYWNHGDNMPVFVDVDLDGKKDIYMTTTGAYGALDHHHLWHQKTPGQFEEIATQAGLLGKDNPNHSGPAFIDIDGDGDLDLLVGDTATGKLRVFKNLVGQDQNWLRVRVVGMGAGASNVSAIGAVVRVTAGGHTQTQYVSGGYGHGNVEADLVLTFGLGAACDVDKVEVRWPDSAGTTTSYSAVLANYNVTVREGAASVEYR